MAPLPDGFPPELAATSTYGDIGELKKGGMGVVYLAKNLLMDRWEVLKVIHPDRLKSPVSGERFLREIRAAAQLLHPNVVVAYSAQQVGDSILFAMEHVPGENLAELVARTGPLSVRRACTFACQIALGLQHAFERNMVHRDIKPGNVIVTNRGGKTVVKIVDFGLAKITSEGRDDGNLTEAGSSLGTPLYMAPEQARDATQADIRADIYSLGATLYFLLAGRPPIVGKNYNDVLIQLITEGPKTPIESIRADVPVELGAIVAKMLAAKPEDRFATPAEVAQALLSFAKRKSDAVEDESTLQPPVAPNSAETPADTTPTPEPSSMKVAPPSQSVSTNRSRFRRRMAFAALPMLLLIGLVIAIRNRPDAELERDWSDYRQATNSFGSRPLIHERGIRRLADWKRAAEGNDARGMVLLGKCFEFGVGVPEDPLQAFLWYHRAAEASNAYAMTNLGYFNRTGKAVKENLPEALKWYRAAASLGEARAMRYLGECYSKGLAVAKDQKEAIKWYRKAAELDCIDAMTELGFCLEMGLGERADHKTALFWYRKAAELGEIMAMRHLDRCYRRGDCGVTIDLKQADDWAVRANQTEKERAILP
jgi:serine/threonine protein kinase